MLRMGAGTEKLGPPLYLLHFQRPQDCHVTDDISKLGKKEQELYINHRAPRTSPLRQEIKSSIFTQQVLSLV